MSAPQKRSTRSRLPACLVGVLLGASMSAGCEPPPGPQPEPTQQPTLSDTIPPPSPGPLTPTPTPTTAPSTSAPPSKPPVSRSGRPSPKPSPVRVPTVGEVRAALLTTADLSGFRPGHDIPNNADGGCPALDTGLDPGTLVTAQVLFEKNGAGPFLRERIIYYRAGAAAAAMAAVRRSPSSCHTFVVTDPNLGKMDYTVTALSTATYGDDTAAVRVAARPRSYPTIVSYENLVVVRHGATLIMIAHTAVGTIDNGFTSTAVSRAYAKVKNRW